MRKRRDSGASSFHVAVRGDRDRCRDRLWASRQEGPFVSGMWTRWVRRSSGAPVRRSSPKGMVRSSKGQVRGGDGGTALVALADRLEEEVRAGLRERHEAELVDDRQLVAGKRLLEPKAPLLVVRLDHRVHDDDDDDDDDDDGGGGEAAAAARRRRRRGGS
jgi:hypothetical protein